MGVNHLNKAKKVKNDEFYTLYQDIEKELSHYWDKLKGKIIYCPCDNENSNFYKYFKNNFNQIGIKKLICSSLDSGVVTIPESVPQRNSVDMFSNQAIELLKECDVVITNPPFSRSREYIQLLFDNNKNFILLGILNQVSYKIIISYLIDNKIFTGYNSGSMVFQNGQKLNNILWWTTFTSAIDERPFYYSDWYMKDAGYYLTYTSTKERIINCDKVKEIPDDYNGLMGVPISFITKINYDQFEIVDCIKPKIGDRALFQRLIIKRK